MKTVKILLLLKLGFNQPETARLQTLIMSTDDGDTAAVAAVWLFLFFHH